MPIYEYMCNACGHELEVLQAISEAPLQDCPQCGQAELRKLISAPIFRLKGGGWYETDFKTDNKRNLAGERATEHKSSESKSAEGKSGESKAGEAKSGEGNSGGGKAGEGKSAKGNTSSGHSEGPAKKSTEA